MDPEQLDFKSKIDSLYFSLFFPALPGDTTEIDLIETPDGEKPQQGFVAPDSIAHDFNFFRIKLHQSKKKYKLL